MKVVKDEARKRWVSLLGVLVILHSPAQSMPISRLGAWAFYLLGLFFA